MSLNLILSLVWLHFFSDFILQTDTMAIRKSSSPLWLTIHVTIYALPFLWFGLDFAFFNFLLHWVTDFFSSKATTYLWKKEKRHWFFVVIGADQALHLTALFWSSKLIHQ